MSGYRRSAADRRAAAAGRRRSGGATVDALHVAPPAQRGPEPEPSSAPPSPAAPPAPVPARVPGATDAASTAMRYGALAVPRPLRVEADGGGTPRWVELDGRRRRVEAVRDDWLVQDLWWTGRPVERRYHELVVHPGRVVVLYEDLVTGRWHRH